MTSDLLLLNRSQVASLLDGQDEKILELVRETYQMHDTGEAVAPHQALLRFPEGSPNRIIAKPSFLAGRVNMASVKWVASFPDNINKGLERASAILVLNSAETGRAAAILEGSLINLKRTGASAAIAAEHLCGECDAAGLIGCGPVNWETLRFLQHTKPSLRTVVLYDHDQKRAEGFADRMGEQFPHLRVCLSPTPQDILMYCPLVSIATSAVKPHITSIPPGSRVSAILHISLRDFSPEVILGCDNIVDDADHACSSSTSLHLTEQQVGHRGFIRSTLGAILRGTAPPKPDASAVTMFSPFGLGTLDLVVGHFLYQSALSRQVGTRIDSFFDEPVVSEGEYDRIK